MQMQTMITCALTALLSRHIRRAQVKKGCKFGKQPVYRRKPRWKDHKIHVVVDALGSPGHFLLTGGNIFDASAAIDLLSEVSISGSNVLGDKAYGTKSIRAYIAEQGASYTIPPKNNVIEPWFCDFHTYKERHLIECFSISSKFFTWSLPAMINSLYPFWPLFISLLFGFC